MTELMGISSVIQKGLVQKDNVSKAVELGQEIQSANDEGDDLKLKETLAEFESVVINIMMESMRKTVPESEMFDNSNSSGRNIYYSMFDMEVSKLASKRGGFGLANLIYEQIKRNENQGALNKGI